MVGGFFPTPYPDECLYSILCRYFVRSGSTSNPRTTQELFGNVQRLSSTLFFPVQLNRIDLWTPPRSGITRRKIALNHTMYPYMAVSYTQNFRNEMERVLNGIMEGTGVNSIGMRKSWRLWPEHLRYCPVCFDEDNILYREPYWHRAHQLPGMAYCTKHQVRIVNSGVPTRETATTFRPASEEIPITEHGSESQDELLPFKTIFLRIGRESEWLLRHGADIDWQTNGRDKYRNLLRENGVATVQGIMDYGALLNSFNRYWGEDFLDALCEETSDFREWLRQFQWTQMRSFRPLYHILLMCFLKGSVKAFLECDASENPFGVGPWPCENSICNHYHVDGASNTEVKYRNGIAIGFFHCADCGMRYKRVKRRGKNDVSIILEYGHIWETEAERCLSTGKMSLSE
ncbi:MAG: TnsD family transposase, partial [Desulfovibrionaceae bacterium]|nr:TnsD family transposase [Desulfovibrionaceae bacterium]